MEASCEFAIAVQVGLAIGSNIPNELGEEWKAGLKRARAVLRGQKIPRGGWVDASWLHEGYGPMDETLRSQVFVVVDVSYALLTKPMISDIKGSFFNYPNLELDIPYMPFVR